MQTYHYNGNTYYSYGDFCEAYQDATGAWPPSHPRRIDGLDWYY
jgi:hypothetical protein